MNLKPYKKNKMEGLFCWIKITALVGCVGAASIHGLAAQRVFTITDYGARGDGQTRCTKTIQKAVDDCVKKQGSKLVFPSGKYRTGPIFLKSNLHIEIEAGATILFDTIRHQVPVVEGRWEGIDRKVYASLFFGKNLNNVTISGQGTMDGQGAYWWKIFYATEAIRKQLNLTTREADSPPESPLPFPRPRIINLYHCTNVLIKGITILNSPSWTIHPVNCENITIDNVTIRTPYKSPNTDGIDPESCRKVTIRNCSIDCGDDCIVLKSGYNEMGVVKKVPCEDVIITDCSFVHGRSAIGIGSEIAGGVRNVSISSCSFRGTLRGIRIKAARGRGAVIENINVSDIVMDSVSEGVSIDMNYDRSQDSLQVPGDKTPLLRNVRLSNITGTHIEKAMNLSGLPESPIQEIHFDKVELHSSQGVKCQYASHISFTNCLIDIRGGSTFFIRHTAAILFDNTVSMGPKSDSPQISVNDSNGLTVRNCRAADNANILVKTNKTENVIIMNNPVNKKDSLVNQK